MQSRRVGQPSFKATHLILAVMLLTRCLTFLGVGFLVYKVEIMTGFTPRVAVRIHEIVLGKDSCKLELLPAEVVYVSHIHKKYLNI